MYVYRHLTYTAHFTLTRLAGVRNSLAQEKWPWILFLGYSC